MKIINLGKENLDIEIQGCNYRLSGEIANEGFIAYANQTTRIGIDSIPISMNDRMELASHMEKSTPEEFILWLKDPSVSINTNLVEMEENEKEVIMKRICNEWKDPNLSIIFVDNKGFVCRTRPEIGKLRDSGARFNILNVEKEKLTIELNERIAQFEGELWENGFNIKIRKMEWIYPEKRKATYEEAVAFIKELKRIYRKEPRENRKKFQLCFMK